MKVLQLFSGGRDSFLSTCRLLDDNNTEVILVAYTNGCCIGNGNIECESDRLIHMYGERVSFHGIHNVVGIWRSFFLPIMNMKQSDILDKYGDVTFSQINCTTCRMAMYVYSIALCKKLGISCISDGARPSQLFAVEQLALINKIRDTLEIMFGISILTPVSDISSNWDRKNELLIRGFFPKTMEQQCLIGVPIDGPLQQCVIDGILQFYEKEIYPRIYHMVNMIYEIMDSNGNIESDEFGGK